MNIIGTIAMLAVLSLSSTNLIAGDNEVENIEPNIIGKTFFFDYGSYAYDIAITSNKSLHWNLVKGSFEGPDQGDNPYLSSKIGDGIVFISWEEESGMQFSNLMNLNTGILTTHANAGGMSVNMGTVSIKK